MHQDLHTCYYHLLYACNCWLSLWLDLVFATFNLILLGIFLVVDGGSSYSGQGGTVGIVVSSAAFTSLIVVFLVKQATDLCVLMSSVER